MVENDEEKTVSSELITAPFDAFSVEPFQLSLALHSFSHSQMKYRFRKPESDTLPVHNPIVNRHVALLRN